MKPDKKIISILAVFFNSVVLAQILVPVYEVKLPEIVHETSGLEIINDSVFITHNDSGDGPNIYFLDSAGKLTGKKELKNAQSYDWEDITYDGKKYLYIGDIGNNSNNRKQLKIHRYDYSDSSHSSMSIDYADQKFPTSEKNRNFDSEGMAFRNDSLFIFTKNNTSPYNGICKYYSYLFKENDDATLQPKDSIVLGDGGLFQHSVTAADFSDNGNILALLTYKHLFLFYDFKEGNPFKGKYAEFLLPEIQQREAICLDSLNNLWMTDEKSRLMNGGKLYKYDLRKFYSGELYYKKPELGIVDAKATKQVGLLFGDFKITNINLSAQISEKGLYTTEILRNGRVMQSKVEEFEKKIEQNFQFNSIQGNIYSIRIYRDNKLLYANQIKTD